MEIDEMNKVEQNRKAHAKGVISKSVQKVKEYGIGVIQGALRYQGEHIVYSSIPCTKH